MTDRSMSNNGLFIAFEGCDGSGKSTQAKLLADRLGAVLTRNPGGTPLGQRLRDTILDPQMTDISPRAEALLFMADRAEQVDALIVPSISTGRHVVTDRYAYSTIAYQGNGRNLSADELWRLAEWSVRGTWPDVVLLIDVPVDVGIKRRRQGRDGEDHYEAAGGELQSAVVEGYYAMAADDPDRWRIVNGVGDVEVVAARVWSVIQPVLRARTLAS